MPLLILLIFVGVPILEIAVLIKVGSAIGLWPTLAAVIGTAVFGTWMLRLQGLSTLRRAQASLAQNQFPAREVFEGLCLVFAGALLLTPGFVTDSLGILILIPPFREFLRRRVFAWMKAHGRIHVSGFGPGSGPGDGFGQDGDVIEGEFEEVHPEKPPERRIPPSER